jgi:hypothetical protein
MGVESSCDKVFPGGGIFIELMNNNIGFVAGQVI